MVLDPPMTREDCTSLGPQSRGAVQSLGILFSTEILRQSHRFGPKPRDPIELEEIEDLIGQVNINIIVET
jgi:hypothetical protein